MSLGSIQFRVAWGLLFGLSAPCISLQAADISAVPVSWHRDSVFYHLYVRSFCDSDGDGHGDFTGLISKLDYIQSLGVDGLLLLPIFQNDHDEYGGYAATDFLRVEADYGGDKAWEAFQKEAARRKLRVLLDFSLTHVADSHPWFQAARTNLTAPERSHFLWAGPPCPKGTGVFGAPTWNAAGDGPCFYAAYGATVPQLNHRNPETVQYLHHVATEWLKRGVQGFRLDSARHVIEVDPALPEKRVVDSAATHAFWKGFMRHLKAVKPDSLAVAEVFDLNPASLNPYFEDGIDMAFDFPVSMTLIDALKTRKVVHLANTLKRTAATRPAGALGAVFLDNHDVPGTMVPPHGRIADFLEGDPDRLKNAALLLFSLPGTPFIYFGDEIGLRGGPREKKRWSRNPMQWDARPGRGFTTGTPWVPFAPETASVAEQEGVEGSLLETYRRLIRIRRSSAALTRGEYREVPASHPAVIAFLRQHGQERVLVVVNVAAEVAQTRLDLSRLVPQPVALTDLRSQAVLPAITATTANAYPIELGPDSGRWLRLE